MKRIGCITVLVLLLGLGAFAALSIDWAAFGPAKPPEGLPDPEVGQYKLTRFRVGQQDGLAAPIRLPWSQHVAVEAIVVGDPGDFQVYSGFLNFARPPSVAKGDEELPVASIRVQLLRKSSIPPGFRVISSVGGKAGVDRSGKLTWNRQLWIPEVPGEYGLQIILVAQRRTGRRQFKFSETVIGNASVLVHPQSQE